MTWSRALTRHSVLAIIQSLSATRNDREPAPLRRSYVDRRSTRSALPPSLVAALGAVTVTLAWLIYALVAPSTVHSQARGPADPMMAMPLTSQVLPPSGFPGFIRTTQPVTVQTASAWATTVEQAQAPTVEASRLRRLGFVAGVDERLRGEFPSQAEAISIVEQYRSASGARAELAYQRTRNLTAQGGPGQTLTLLHAVGIPGATGWEVRSGEFTGINMMFSSGSTYYLVGAGFKPGTHKAPTAAEVVSGARLLYLLVHGCVSAAASGRDIWPRAI